MDPFIPALVAFCVFSAVLFLLLFGPSAAFRDTFVGRLYDFVFETLPKALW